LWSAESPSLYIAKLAFVQGKDILDNVDATFGFREVGFANGSLTVNGSALSIRGTRYHSFHALSIAGPEDAAAAKREVEHAKEVGLNLLWVVGMPSPSILLDAADRAGILVVEGPESETEAEVDQLVRRDRGHPCVICWNCATSGASDEGF